ncbi:hypothetical protein ALC57_08351, partial [Trachymyrmex cornetzi]
KASVESQMKFSGFNLFFKSSQGTSGGIVILSKRHLNVYLINNINCRSNNIDVIGIKICNVIPNINVVAVYRRPYNVDNYDAWNDIFGFDYQGVNTLIVGDFNAHNSMWNCFDTDKNGENLSKSAGDNGYFCLNFDTMTRIGDIRQRSSNLDLIFCSIGILGIADYQQLQDSWGSESFSSLVGDKY